MTIKRSTEVQRLQLAERHIAQARQHIQDQRLIVQQLRTGDPGTEDAERLLEIMETALGPLLVHRQEILEMIAWIDKGAK